jgi:hypothetical protein
MWSFWMTLCFATYQNKNYSHEYLATIGIHSFL